MTSPPYIGRFAPSPTGPLHLGSLLAALASYLDAKANHGLWLLRIEDIDPPREQPGASGLIIEALSAHGLVHDGDIHWQSANSERYLNILSQLKHDGLLFPCRCSRQQLSQHQGIHHGRCSHQDIDFSEPGWAWRLDMNSVNYDRHFVDAIQGRSQQNLYQQVGDVVLRRKDGLFAYQLAVVVDDIDQGVSDIVRGVDLIDSSLRQIYLHHCLGQGPRQYKHLPLILNAQGQKLSKQNHAPELKLEHANANLFHCLRLLNQQPPTELQHQPLSDLLQWGVQNWNIQAIPKTLNSVDAHQP